MQLFLLILMTCTVALILVDIIKSDQSVKRAAILATMSLIICYLCHTLEHGTWPLWFATSGIWIFLIFLRNYANQIRRDMQVQERWRKR
jgi:hypothetical protein